MLLLFDSPDTGQVANDRRLAVKCCWTMDSFVCFDRPEEEGVVAAPGQKWHRCSDSGRELDPERVPELKIRLELWRWTDLEQRYYCSPRHFLEQRPVNDATLGSGPQCMEWAMRMLRKLTFEMV